MEVFGAVVQITAKIMGLDGNPGTPERILFLSFALQVFFMNDRPHRLIIYFTLHPGNDIEIGESPCFKPVLLKMFDRM